MTQTSTRSVSYRTMFHHPAFRQGFEDVRTGAKPKFDDDWGLGYLAYEYGRLIAAQALATSHQLPPLGVSGRIPASTFQWLKEQHRNYRLEIIKVQLNAGRMAA